MILWDGSSAEVLQGNKCTNTKNTFYIFCQNGNANKTAWALLSLLEGHRIPNEEKYLYIKQIVAVTNRILRTLDQKADNFIQQEYNLANSALIQEKDASKVLDLLNALAADEQKPEELSQVYKEIGTVAYLTKSGIEASIAAWRNVNELSPNDASVLLITANLLFRTGSMFELDEMYQDAIILFEKQGNKLGIAASYYNLGLFFIESNDFEKAYNSFATANKLYQELHNREGLILSYTQLGTLSRAAHDFDQAIERHKKALRLLEKTSHLRHDEYLNYFSLGLIYHEVGQYKEARNMYLRAIRIYGTDVYRNSINVVIYKQLGKVYLAQNKMEEAIKNFKSASELYREIGNTPMAEEVNALISTFPTR